MAEKLRRTGDKLEAVILTRRSLPGLAKDLTLSDATFEELVKSLPGRGGSRDYLVVDRSEEPPYWVTMPGELFHHYYEWETGPDGRALSKVVAK